MSLAILCSGQGAQFADMLLPLQALAPARPVLQALQAVTGMTPARLAACAPDALFANRLAQPSICAVQLATWQALRAHIPAPRVFAGYSIGELAAYACADALDAAATFELALKRAELMDATHAEPAGMIAVSGLTRAGLGPLAAAAGAEIAIVNGPDRFVVGGALHGLRSLTAACVKAGAHVTPLPVGVASHTSLLRAAVAPFRQVLDAASPRDPSVPVLAGIDGLPVFKAARAKDVLAKQIAQTIDWRACLDALPEMGCRAALELGPGGDLARMARDQVPGVDIRAVAEFRSLDGAAAWAARHAT